MKMSTFPLINLNKKVSFHSYGLFYRMKMLNGVIIYVLPLIHYNCTSFTSTLCDFFFFRKRQNVLHIYIFGQTRVLGQCHVKYTD